MNTRIKKLRKHFDLTQKDFAERIGLKQNSIALIESGKRNISDQAILSICREFKASEKWLRTGKGEMFVPAPTSELDALSARYPQMTHESYVFIEKLVNLPKENQDIIMGFFREVVHGFGDVAPGTLANPSPVQELNADAEGNTHQGELDLQSLHDELDSQYNIEKKAAEKSEVS